MVISLKCRVFKETSPRNGATRQAPDAMPYTEHSCVQHLHSKP